MQPTQDILAGWFRLFNGTYFQGRLVMPLFAITRARGYLGQCHCSLREPVVIRISVFYDRSELEVQTTFLHEMIHLWQFQTRQKLNHGDSFKGMAALIYRLSGGTYAITRCSHVDPAQVAAKEAAKGPVSCDVLVWRDKRGICVSRVADGYASSLLSWFSDKHPDCTLYRARGVVFRSFRRSMQRINYRRFTQVGFDAQIAPYLQDYQPTIV